MCGGRYRVPPAPVTGSSRTRAGSAALHHGPGAQSLVARRALRGGCTSSSQRSKRCARRRVGAVNERTDVQELLLERLSCSAVLPAGVFASKAQKVATRTAASCHPPLADVAVAAANS
mmetsp:Transcript_28277/g.68748  ORF Transcript_28277/g.68748 Transcript_28277/m.68748 type:complete len:118 (+) Transcript_28277:139-492(+)